MNPIPISKGAYKPPFGRALRNVEYAENLINLMIGPAGENFDRPTLSSFAELDSTDIIGSYYFAGVVVVVTSDRKVYTVDVIGEVTDVTGVSLPGILRPVFTNDADACYIVGGGAPIKWSGIGTLTALLGGSPPEMSHITYLDGYLIGNTLGGVTIRFSDYATPETWTGTNVFSAVADPDPIEGVEVAQRELYVVGSASTEVWQNIGTSPVPFARAFVFQHGTPAPYSVHTADGTVFMLDQNHQIMRFLGRQPTRISEAIENDLFGYEVVSDCFARSFTWKGSVHVLFVFPTAEKAWSIDLKNGQWSEWRGWSAGWSRVRIGALVYCEDTGLVFAGDWQTGVVWQFSATEKTDAGGIFKRVRTFSHLDGGASIRKRCNMLRVNLNRDVAAEYTGTEDETNPTLELRWKDDDRGWSEWRRAQLGEKGELAYYADFRRLGIYRTRQYELQMSDPASLEIVGVETDDTVMGR